MKARLTASRAVVHALQGGPRCPELIGLTAGWDGKPSPLWRKRLARHTRDCPHCSGSWSEQVPAERLLAGLAPVPAPLALLAVEGGRHAAAVPGWWARLLGPHKFLLAKPIVAAVTGVAVVAGAGAAAYALRDQPPATVAAGTVSSPSAASAAPPVPSAAPSSPARSPSPSPKAVPPPAPKTTGPVARSSARKGVSAWYFDGFTQALADVHATWYYNWAAGRGNLTAPAGVEFVPMIWGAKSVTAATLSQAKGQGKVLLGFNEPDLAGQANMPVAQALDLWPQLAATGMRLGSPAPATGADRAGGWLDQFMSGAAARGYRVDFIALHWYGSDFSAAATSQLRSYLQATYNRYHKPIWLTEYALINFSGGAKYPTQSQQAAFVKASTAMLDSLSYVERYAWFALPATNGSGTGLYQNGTTPTEVGTAYRAAS
jgi:hypothetical protein